MKKFLLLFVFIGFGISGFSQDVVEVQKSLVTKRTATWCPFCGQWGWELFDGIIEDNSDKAVYMAAHFGGSMLENPTSLALVSNLGGAGQPRFFFNNEFISASSSSIGAARTTFQNKIDDAFATSPIANTGLEATIEDDMLTVKSKVRFFQEATGEFYMGLYVVEDGVVANQAGISGQAVHKKVLRGAFTDDHFGDLLDNGTIAADTEFDNTYTLAIPDYNVEEVEIAAVIWRKVGTFYNVVNVWSTTDIEEGTATSTEEVAAVMNASLLPTIALQQSTLQLDLASPKEVQISVYNMLGQAVQRVYTGSLPEGRSQFEITRPGRGTFLVQVQSNDQLLTRKVLFQ
jgi:hypothetical protein